MSISSSSSSGNSDRGTKVTLEASQTEREAMRRIADAHRQVQVAERDARERLNQIRDEYERQSGAEGARQETQLEATRLKGYQNIRNQQKGLQAEVNRTQKEGSRELTDLQNHYRDSIYQTRNKGEQDLMQTKQEHGRQLEYETSMAKSALENEQIENKNRVEDLRYQHDQALTELRAAERKEYETLKAQTAESKEHTKAHFDASYQTSLKEQKEVLDRINSRAAAEIEAVRSQTSRKLAAYNQRQQDPFYKMMDLNARIDETHDAYILRANIPVHEKDRVVVSIRGDSVLVSGTRRNEELLKDQEGGQAGTSSYQSFFQAFPIIWPVDARAMERSFDGDTLTVRIPKKTTTTDYKPYASNRRVPEKVRAERPKFPSNLPYQEMSNASPSGSKVGPDGKEAKETDEATFLDRRAGKTLG
jgi:HSP20 family molecular chaperone IbpA